jgi:prolyl-tRNA editing enzyme YbaK/EbsC (Cys-tRNA(Pro) deacylase)
MKDKVVRRARELGLEVEVQKLETSTRTVKEAASAVGCDEAEIAKSVVFVCDGEPVVCVASGEHRIDADKLAEVHDCAEVRQAGPDEVRAATGFAVGAVPPIGHGLPVVIDEALLRHRRVWAAAGDPQSLFCLDPRELVDRIQAEIAEVAEVGTVA